VEAMINHNQFVNLALCYLSWGGWGEAIGLKKAVDYLQSYQTLPAGIEHKHYLILTGWEARDTGAEKQISNLFESIGATVLRLSDKSLDLGAYYFAAKVIPQKYICFLNSHSQPCAPNWLLYLSNAIRQDDVGIAGPGGSFGSAIRPVPLKRLFLYPRSSLKLLFENHSKKKHFANFPCPHIRTSSFIIKREVLLSYFSQHKVPTSKYETYAIEHGKSNLTNFVFKLSLRALVVNSDGVFFEKDEWLNSKTFLLEHQEKLIVSDKMSNQYAELLAISSSHAELIYFSIWDGYNKKYLLSRW
jgi:hypothetical protein